MAGKIIVKRVIEYEGDPEWVNLVLSKSMAQLGRVNEFGESTTGGVHNPRTIKLVSEERIVCWSDKTKIKDRLIVDHELS